jgi:hypothetical protein
VTTRLCGSDSGCVTISLMILNQTIQRYVITDCCEVSSQVISEF